MRTRGRSEDFGRASEPDGSIMKFEGMKPNGILDKICTSSDLPVLPSQSDHKGRSRAGSMDCSISSENSDTKVKKKKRGREGIFDGNEVPGDIGVQSGDFRIFESCFPKEFEPEFSTAVFELGLKHSSPKVLMSLMPMFTNLHSEHLKSHLQKYRIHHERSKDEFLAFYNEFMKDDFLAWEERKGWEAKSVKKGCSSSLIDQSSSTSYSLPNINSINSSGNASMDNIGSPAAVPSVPSPYSRSGAQGQGLPPKPSDATKDPKNFAGYKNIVAQASQLYAEWRTLYEESVHGTSKIGNSNFVPVDFEPEPKFSKIQKGGRQATILPPKNYKEDSNGWPMREEDEDIAHNAFLHNDPVFGFLDNGTNNVNINSNGNSNVNINGNGNGNGNVNVNVNSVKNGTSYNGRALQSMPPAHPNPFNSGYTPCYSYSATYNAASLPASLSHFRSAQQQSLIDMNVSHISQQNPLNQAKNHNPNINNLNNNYSLPNTDTFAPPALSSSLYLPQMSALVRNASIDESGDHTDHSCSNESNNGDNIINIPNQSYFYDLKEQNRNLET